MQTKNKFNQLISYLSICIYIISGVLLLSSVSTTFAIDYIEITNPKFIPVKVGVATQLSTDAKKIQKVAEKEGFLFDFVDKNLIKFCITEKRSKDDIDNLVEFLKSYNE